MKPPGAGARVYADLARKKIGQALRRNDTAADVGVLAANPHSESSEAPLAVVCEFPNPISDADLGYVHRLAWNFCRSPLLVTAEPHLLRAWSCYERPPVEGQTGDHVVEVDTSLSGQAARTLEWMSLASGHFLSEHRDRFKPNQRADRLLLANLKHVRAQLHQEGVPPEIVHALLARLIFVQFLFHRQDANGRSALGAERLRRLSDEGVLQERHDSLRALLRSKEDTYAFFAFLNTRFNGDLFPGTGATEEEQEREWDHEREIVQPQHLEVLARFVGGTLDMPSGQHCLWPQYSFDVVPLEFVSSIYESFLQSERRRRGAYYTPGHLVDFMLDQVLPWEGQNWDVRILDPACGSGIFLVKAFQRLVHRWRRAHAPHEPSAGDLRQLLERNLFGVDIEPEAVRVASFSLYLAMCDEIDPRQYWTQVKFPRLRGQRLVAADFFDDAVLGVRTEEDAGSYDLVVGNAPWGERSETPAAQEWAGTHGGWPIPNRQIGTLFLPKAAALTKSAGRVCMLQPAASLLYNRDGPSRRFRQRLFEGFKVDEVVNLAALRKSALFARSTSPVCLIRLRPTAPDGQPLVYCHPKPTRTPEDAHRIPIDPHDTSHLFPEEAAREPWIWSALSWGGRRDVALIRRLRDCRSLSQSGEVRSRLGFERGKKEQKEQPAIVGLRRLEEPEEFPEDTFLRLDASALTINRNPLVHKRDSTDFSAFALPQLIAKRSWRADRGRFEAAMVRSGPAADPVICSQSYVSMHVPRGSSDLLEAACLVYNSLLAVYYFLLTSGRVAFYIPELLAGDVLQLPIPEPSSGLLDGLQDRAQVDKRVCSLFGLTEVEWALIEDACRMALPHLRGGASLGGQQPTGRTRQAVGPSEQDGDLHTYCDWFLRVMEAGFGAECQMCATIYEEDDRPLPLRLVAVHLEWAGPQRVGVASMAGSNLSARLATLSDLLVQRHGDESGGIAYQRIARVYDTVNVADRRVPTVYLVKPDQRRYWTRSAALRDADAVTADVMLWQDVGGGPRGEGGAREG